jgi:hypothetical protein
MKDNRKRGYRPQFAAAIKAAVIAFYSNGAMVCNSCGYNDLRALSIDHVANDGHNEPKGFRGGNNLYHALKRKGFPPGFQVLCLNCNWIKESERRKLYGRKHE